MKTNEKIIIFRMFSFLLGTLVLKLRPNGGSCFNVHISYVYSKLDNVIDEEKGAIIGHGIRDEIITIFITLAFSFPIRVFFRRTI